MNRSTLILHCCSSPARAATERQLEPREEDYDGEEVEAGGDSSEPQSPAVMT